MVPPLRAQRPRLFLRLADVQHPLRARELAQVLLRPVVLALEPLEPDQVHPFPPREAFDGPHERPRHRLHQRRRRHRIAAHLAEEVRRAGARPRHRHVDVEAHPVDALQLQRGVLGQRLGGVSCYVSWRGLRSMGSPQATIRPPTPCATMKAPSRRGAEQRPGSVSTAAGTQHMPRRSEAKPR